MKFTTTSLSPNKTFLWVSMINDAEALRGPELDQVGQLLVPGDLPHVGRGGDAVRDQGPRGNRTTVPGF